MASIDTYIVDLNSYFRIAQSIHPLLNKIFGSKIKLLIHQYFERQYYKQTQLQTKFPWYDQIEYKKNREKKISISSKQKIEIDQTYDYIADQQKAMHLGLLYDDIFCLAYAQVLGYKVVTDEADMKRVAEIYEIKVIDTLDLLKILFDIGEIDEDKVKEIVGYWVYNSDLPNKNIRLKFVKVFPNIKISF